MLPSRFPYITRQYASRLLISKGEAAFLEPDGAHFFGPLYADRAASRTSFFFVFRNILVIDPTHEESTLSTGTMTVTLNAQRELCVLSKAGGSPLSVDELMRVVKLGAERVKELVRQLEDGLKADWEVRRKVIEVQ